MFGCGRSGRLDTLAMRFTSSWGTGLIVNGKLLHSDRGSIRAVWVFCLRSASWRRHQAARLTCGARTERSVRDRFLSFRPPISGRPPSGDPLSWIGVRPKWPR